MEITYCNNCGFQIAADAFAVGNAVKADDGKNYCAKCVPLFENTSSVLMKVSELPAESDAPKVDEKSPAVTKFYFCETCGKRITDKQILEGQGRDKKLKGVYCKDCAVGVMTMEMDAINIEQLAKPKTKQHAAPASFQSKPPSTQTRKVSGTARAHETIKQPPAILPGSPKWNYRAPALIAIGVAIVLGGIVLAVAASSTHVAAVPKQPEKPEVIPPDSRPAATANTGAPAANESVPIINTTTSTTTTTAATAEFVRCDSTTGGAWKTVYGQDGFWIVRGDPIGTKFSQHSTSRSSENSLFPSYLTAIVVRGAAFNNSGDGPVSTHSSGLQYFGSNYRGGGYLYSGNSLSVELNLTGGKHQVAFYCIPSKYHPTQQIEVFDYDNQATALNIQKYSYTSGASYLVWNIAGHVLFKFTAGTVTEYKPYCWMNGMFLDPPPQK